MKKKMENRTNNPIRFSHLLSIDYTMRNVPRYISRGRINEITGQAIDYMRPIENSDPIIARIMSEGSGHMSILTQDEETATRIGNDIGRIITEVVGTENDSVQNIRPLSFEKTK
jgi:hypothetical protein